MPKSKLKKEIQINLLFTLTKLINLSIVSYKGKIKIT